MFFVLFFENSPICRLPVKLDVHRQTSRTYGLINETVKTFDGPPRKTGSSITGPIESFVHWSSRNHTTRQSIQTNDFFFHFSHSLFLSFILSISVFSLFSLSLSHIRIHLHTHTMYVCSEFYSTRETNSLRFGHQ